MYDISHFNLMNPTFYFIQPQEPCDSWKSAFIAVSIILLLVLLLGIIACVCSR